MSSFSCTYMALSSLIYLPGFSVIFFFIHFYTNYAYYEKKVTEIWAEMIFGWTRYWNYACRPTLHPSPMMASIIVVKIALDWKKNHPNLLFLLIRFRSQNVGDYFVYKL